MLAFAFCSAIVLYACAHLLLAGRGRLGLSLEVATLVAMGGWMLAVGIITFLGVTSGQWRIFMLVTGSVLLIPCANHLRHHWTNEGIRRLARE